MTKSHPKILRNNFDLIRLCLAIVVFFSHAYALSNNKALERLGTVFNAVVAVESFFVISGFLIFMSYENSRSLRDYFRKRARRIYPAYVVVVMLCAAGGLFITKLPLSKYLAGAFGYLAANLVFLNSLHRALPGVFTLNRFPDVDGALWTIKVEVMFYLSVPLIVIAFNRVGRIPALTAIYCLSLIYRAYFQSIGGFELMRQLPGQMCFFVAGALIYYYFAYFESTVRWILPTAIATVAVETWWQVMFLYPLALAAIVIFLACCVPMPKWLHPKWDLSYGVYIIHFPVLQVLVSWKWFEGNPARGILAAAAITLVLASLSWNIVEKRFLSRRTVYKNDAAATAAQAY